MLWISSSGGPLVVLPKSARHEWHGAPRSDYDLACSVRDYAGVVAWRARHILVLGDEPLRTAVTRTDTEVNVLRWMYAPNESSILGCLEPKIWGAPVEVTDWIVNEPEQVLFDSAIPGQDIEQAIEFRLASGVFKVRTYLVKPSSDTGAIIHSVQFAERFALGGKS